MKITATIITTLALGFSISATASSPVEALSVESVKQFLTPTQIQATLDAWRENELKRIDMTKIIQFRIDGAPAGAREKMARLAVEQQYLRAEEMFDL
ncbi:hypothetical protein [Photobacterium rosenbergii]|uniref:Uncharacterized protein n=1 Tax=Photobacterium rosenbergii TaxID=294936 RepID=A0ABU3ZNK9_9GAMM|nr:hypothetical protein [Photobacterium rosenbergii]MDV5171612.1 hypothetical protein [Photobacterium rosenbergii]